jgi:hypothetical protein
MADDEKVISLDSRRRGAAQPVQPERSGKATPKGGAPREPLPGQIIWLHCPTCGTFEFTELAMAGGRTHRPCGTIVEEVPVDVDLRAEYTIAELNLQRLHELTRLIEGQIGRFEEYQRRLTTLAGQRPVPYDVDDPHAPQLPVAEMDALGMLVSQAMHNPQARFAGAAAPGGDGPDAEMPDDDGGDAP